MHRSIIITQPTLLLYHGWLVVAAAFLVALYGFGLGFYGPGIYLVALNTLHGWPISELSSAITTYYVLGATLLFFWVGPLFEPHGARKVVVVGTVAMALRSDAARACYAALACIRGVRRDVDWVGHNERRSDQYHRRAVVRQTPWLGCELGAERGKRWRYHYRTTADFLMAKFGFALAIVSVSASMLAILIPVTLVVLRPRRADECDPVERAGNLGTAAQTTPASAVKASGFRLTTLLRSGVFISISVPFALALTAQVGFLTHQIGFLSRTIGTVAAGWAVSLTTFAAVLGRIVTGYIADRFDRRVVACVNFIVQMFGMAILATATVPTMLYLGCAFFGLGVGNTTSLPGLLVQQEFAKQHFARIVSLVVAINQFRFAFGPSLLGQLEKAAGGYSAGLLACLLMEGLAALIVISPAIIRYRQARFKSEAWRHRNRDWRSALKRGFTAVS